MSKLLFVIFSFACCLSACSTPRPERPVASEELKGAQAPREKPVTVEYKWMPEPHTHGHLAFTLESIELGKDPAAAVNALKRRNIGCVIIQSEGKLADYWIEAIELEFSRGRIVIAEFWMPSSSVSGGVDVETRRRKRL
jgi:hypothetical protein